MEKLLKPADVAARLGVKLSTVYVWVHRRQIPFIKVGRCVRFAPGSIQRWLEAQERRPLADATASAPSADGEGR